MNTITKNPIQAFRMVARTVIAQYMKEMRKKYKLTQVDLSENSPQHSK